MKAHTGTTRQNDALPENLVVRHYCSRSLACGGDDFLDDECQLVFEPEPEREPNQSLTQVHGIGHIPDGPADFLTHGGAVQRHVVENGQNLSCLELVEKSR